MNLATSPLPATIAGLTASMSIRRWTDAEIAIAVYFASRNAGYKACAKIIFYKTERGNLESRTSLSVRNKLHGIRMTGDLWRLQTGWNLEAVDNYLISLNVYSLQNLVSAGEAKLVMIPEIRCRRGVISQR